MPVLDRCKYCKYHNDKKKLIIRLSMSKKTLKGRITVKSSFYEMGVGDGGGGGGRRYSALPPPLSTLQPASRQTFKGEITPPPRIFLQAFKKRKRRFTKTVFFLTFKELRNRFRT